jgi:hypothetical protein
VQWCNVACCVPLQRGPPSLRPLRLEPCTHARMQTRANTRTGMCTQRSHVLGAHAACFAPLQQWCCIGRSCARPPLQTIIACRAAGAAGAAAGALHERNHLARRAGPNRTVAPQRCNAVLSCCNAAQQRCSVWGVPLQAQWCACAGRVAAAARAAWRRRAARGGPLCRAAIGCGPRQRSFAPSEPTCTHTHAHTRTHTHARVCAHTHAILHRSPPYCSALQLVALHLKSVAPRCTTLHRCAARLNAFATQVEQERADLLEIIRRRDERIRQLEEVRTALLCWRGTAVSTLVPPLCALRYDNSRSGRNGIK